VRQPYRCTYISPAQPVGGPDTTLLIRRGQSTGEDCFAQKEGVLHSAVSVCSLKDDNVVTPLGPWDHLRLGDAAVITEHSR